MFVTAVVDPPTIYRGDFRPRTDGHSLAAEAVEGTTLTFERVDDVHGRDGLPFGVFGISDRVPDDVLEEHFEHAASLFVYEAGDAFHSAATSESPDGGLRDALDVIAQYFAMSLCASFSQTFATLSSSGHLFVFRLSVR